VFYNLLSKLEEYSHVRGSALLLIYCLLKAIRVNIPKLIVSYMASEHLLIPNWHLPFGILIARLLKQLKFNLSTKRSIEPSVNINSTLLKMMRARERVPALQPLLSFLQLYLDPPQPLLLLLIHIQSFLLSFGSMT